MNTLTVILIPFFGTVLGSAAAFLMKKELEFWLEKFLLGFAVGVMIAASLWSLLIPSIEQSGEMGVVPWIPAATGFILGSGFLLILDTVIPHLHLYSRQHEGPEKNLSGKTMLYLAVTLHNFPEGMAVGAIISAAMQGTDGVTMTSAAVLALGIAIQNFPEGAIISMPLRSGGMAKGKAFGLGALSGMAEPAGALITIIAANSMTALLPYFLAFAAGAMIYVVVDELIPESRSDECFNVSTIGTVLGFSLMMVLDVSLG